MNKLSVIIPTLNEELFIKDAILTASFADEIIIIDSYSTDKTIELAKKHPVKILQREFDDFSSQKNYAIDKASYNWIFILDADEKIPSALKKEIQQVLQKENKNVAYEVLCSHIFMGKRMKYSTFKNEWKLRFFNKEFCKYGKKLVHEDMVINGTTGRLKNHFDHYTYRSFDHFISKKNKYAWLQAEEYYKKNKKPSFYHFVIKPSFRFFNQFILRGGFLDGFPGFASAYINSYGVMTRYIKLWLLHKGLK
ncbi:glycosyltransferase family 2 protein [Galbibacter sp. EGI 63066]|uniref:glycosyltransferase family 2 protein n=1 Tax=Galbibacter sp. EGI 63066 TaxID=2993559 RepID=UPI002249868A|nr:glycosyltransferase family 2 protein [Galbibacter sp. EGI 63066]MCX2678545.1 glycosyltransferase family 2 protein [Galbibacter sp. EGI 63066]